MLARPALRRVTMRPAEAIAPMHLPTLMAECVLPAELSTEVSVLMTRKAVTRELGAAPLSRAVARFIDSEFEFARKTFEPGRALERGEVVRQEAQFYSTAVEKLERQGSQQLTSAVDRDGRYGTHVGGSDRLYALTCAVHAPALHVSP